MARQDAGRLLAAGFLLCALAFLVWLGLGSPGRGPDAESSGTAAGNTAAGADPAADQQVPEPIPDLGAAPRLVGITEWLNTSPTGTDASVDPATDGLGAMGGEVTIVQFWTFGCRNCQATIPHLQELYAAQHRNGLEIIGVHAHEFEHERDPGRIAAAVDELGVTWPVALDSDKVNFRAWQGSPRYWPRTYVIDQAGRVRFDHIGEGAYGELADTVTRLLEAGGSGATTAATEDPTTPADGRAQGRGR